MGVTSLAGHGAAGFDAGLVADLEGGTRIALGGELPLNTNGGQLSAGRLHGFGFEADRVTVREDEAAVVRDLVVRHLAGESIKSLCRDLNERGVPTPTGRA